MVAKNELVKLTACLKIFLGFPISLSKLPVKFRMILKQHGGIKSGQTLYFSCAGSDIVISLLWPWDDGVHTTVKIIKI